MGASRYISLFLPLLLAFVLNAEETFRTFTAVGGQSFTARVLSYEGQTFYLEGKDKKTISRPLQPAINRGSVLPETVIPGRQTAYRRSSKISQPTKYKRTIL